MTATKFQLDLLKLIKTGEGNIPHMYLDTVGKVTVGVGNMLPTATATATATAAQALPFLLRANNTPATKEQIGDEFALVSRQQMGKAASSYAQYTKLYLPENKVDELLAGRIAEFTAGLIKSFPQYEQFPDPAKLALMDMAFNLGNAGLVNKFPSLTRAANAHNWAECAIQCHRNGISDHRNAEVKEMFLQA